MPGVNEAAIISAKLPFMRAIGAATGGACAGGCATFTGTADGGG